MALRAYKFTMKGLALGAEAIIISTSYEDALRQATVLSMRGDIPICENEKGEPIKAGVLHFWNGDY